MGDGNHKESEEGEDVFCDSCKIRGRKAGATRKTDASEGGGGGGTDRETL